MNIGSDLTLDGSEVYIFQIQGALTTAANTAIILKGGADACQVFWVADVVMLGAGSTFGGTSCLFLCHGSKTDSQPRRVDLAGLIVYRLR